MTVRIGWVDATGGVSGDMLLGACLDAGVELGLIQQAVDGLGLPETVVFGSERVVRGGLGATQALVAVSAADHHRGLDDVLTLLRRTAPDIADPAGAVFRSLAEAEARVHQTTVEQVHFHEVGGLDSIADVVGVVAALSALRLDRLVCSPIALGGGRADTGHGPIPVPGPAVLELLRASRAPGFGGPVDTELATPTGVALLTTLADEFGALPPLRPEIVGIGAGNKDPAGHANITRIVIGEPAEPAPALDGSSGSSGSPALAGLDGEPAVVLETNVDDLDPRLWPQVLASLLDAGASDAWLTPIAMKKGRPAHTLSVLAVPDLAGSLERVVFAQTSTIGLRRRAVDKVALAREFVSVDVHGAQVRVKVARLDGDIVTAVPEYDDVVRVAAEHGVPTRVVLDAATVAAASLRDA